jgi:3-deoxy-D-manno-octulosonic-acid transferase
MARLLYAILMYLLTPLVLLHLWHRGIKAPAYRQRWGERFGCKPKPKVLAGAGPIKPGSIVFHCASVGEVVAATPLIKQVQQRHPNYPVLVTCNTPTGTEQIKRSFADTVQHVYLPLDLPGAVKRFLTHTQPALLCILETELWPNLISQSQQQGIAVLVINARLSEKSQRGYQKIAPLTKTIMAGITAIAAHDSDDAERFIALGLSQSKVNTTGSIKFDITLSTYSKQQAQQLRQQFSANQPVWIAGSTHEGEDEQVLEAHQAVLAKYPQALLILVPRHPERFDKVAQLVSATGLAICRRSTGEAPQGCQVLLGDTMGELLTLYGVADVAFIGGSLIERGGHNPLEAAAYQIPVVTGPHVFNFNHVYPALLQQQGCLQIDSGQALPAVLLKLFDDKTLSAKIGQQGELFVRKNQGAIGKTVKLIGQYL